MAATAKEKYSYVNIADLKTGIQNVFGVVTFCKTPTKSRGTDFVQVLSLTDNSLNEGEKLVVSLFYKSKEYFPPAAVGDVVRFHRLLVEEINGDLKGRPGPGFSWLLIQDDVDKPIVSSQKYTYDQQSKDRVTELMQWMKTQRWMKEKPAPATLSSLVPYQYYDLVCQVIATITEVEDVCFVARVWDGTRCFYPALPIRKEMTTRDDVLEDQAGDSAVDIWIYDDHVASCTNIQPGDFIQLANLHAAVCKEDNANDPLNSPTLELTIHRGTSYGRGVSVLDENCRQVAVVRRRMEEATSKRRKATSDSLTDNADQRSQCPHPTQSSSTCTTGQSTTNRSATNRSATNRSATNQSATDRNATSQSSTNQSATHQSATNTCATHQNATNRSATNQNTTNQNATIENATHQSATNESATNLSATNQNASNLSATNESATNQSATHRSATNQNATHRSATNQSATHRSASNQSSSKQSSSHPQSHESTEGSSLTCMLQTATVVTGHHHINHTSIQNVLQGEVPGKFRVLATLVNFHPNTTDPLRFFTLICPQCSYLTNPTQDTLHRIREERQDRREPPPPPAAQAITPHIASMLARFFGSKFSDQTSSNTDTDVTCDSSEDECPRCKDQGKTKKMELIYMLRLVLTDAGGQTLMANLWRDQAVTFFHGISPHTAMKHQETLEELVTTLRALRYCARRKHRSPRLPPPPSLRLDCCLMSYKAVSGVNFQLFDTTLV